MALTVGGGPFGHAPAGTFNRELPSEGLLFLEPFPRRMRGLLGGEVVVDSVRATMLHEQGFLPRLYYPADDVREGLLVPSGRRDPGSAAGERDLFDLRLGDRVVAGGAFTHPEPPDGLPELAGLVAFYFAALDGWLEEDEPVEGHARDPYHRVDALASSRLVRVWLDGELLAESRRPTVVYETGLVPRWYLPREDVRAELLEGNADTVCAYKGRAAYWSLQTLSGLRENVAWTYADPRQAVAAIAGKVAFFDEHVDIEVDGERRDRPRTPWSAPRWWETVHEVHRGF